MIEVCFHVFGAHILLDENIWGYAFIELARNGNRKSNFYLITMQNLYFFYRHLKERFKY